MDSFDILCSFSTVSMRKVFMDGKRSHFKYLMPKKRQNENTITIAHFFFNISTLSLQNNGFVSLRKKVSYWLWNSKNPIGECCHLMKRKLSQINSKNHSVITLLSGSLILLIDFNLFHVFGCPHSSNTQLGYSRSAGINNLIVEGFFTIVVCGSNAEKCATNHRPCSTLEEEQAEDAAECESNSWNESNQRQGSMSS